MWDSNSRPGFPSSGVQDRCNKPDSANLPLIWWSLPGTIRRLIRARDMCSQLYQSPFNSGVCGWIWTNDFYCFAGSSLRPLGYAYIYSGVPEKDRTSTDRFSVCHAHQLHHRNKNVYVWGERRDLNPQYSDSQSEVSTNSTTPTHKHTVGSRTKTRT